MKITTSQLKRIIKEEVSKLVEARPRAKNSLPKVGQVYALGRDTYEVEVVSAGTIYCTVLSKGRASEKEFTPDQWNDLLAKGLKFSHQQEW